MRGEPTAPPSFDLRGGNLDGVREAIAARGLDVTDALASVLATIQSLGAALAVLEPEYIDADYRDEYVHYYAYTYRPLPTRCGRLHFFGEEEDGLDPYLGYCVLRPIRDHPVCRTVIAPPSDLAPYVSCVTHSVVHPSGQLLKVAGFPFMEQDSLYGVCAHASIWMVALYHHLEHGTPRQLMSNIRTGAISHQERFRVAPSDGLSEQQVGAALQHIGLDAIQYSLAERPRNTIAATICRYLNSRLPVILTTRRHVTVLIGYGYDRSGRLFFVQHDESRGPYRRYALADLLDAFRLLLVPVPGKIYLTGESAEIRAETIFANLLADESPAQALDMDTLRLRTYVTRSGDYKIDMERRGLGPLLRDHHKFVGTSTWIWVVELQDLTAATSSPACVIGEVAFDATSSNLQPGPLFAHLQDNAWAWGEFTQPDTTAELNEASDNGITLGATSKVVVDDYSPYLSGTALHNQPAAERSTRGVGERLRAVQMRMRSRSKLRSD